MITDEDLKRAFKNSFIEYDEYTAYHARQAIKEMSVIFNYKELLDDQPDYVETKTIVLDEDTDFSESDEYEDEEVDIVLNNAPIVRSRNIIYNNN